MYLIVFILKSLQSMNRSRGIVHEYMCVYVVGGSLQIEIFTAGWGTVEKKWIG